MNPNPTPGPQAGSQNFSGTPNGQFGTQDQPTGSLKDEARKAGASIAEVAGSVAADLKEVASEKLSAAASAAGEQSNAMKDQVAEEVNNVAQALRNAAADMRSGSPQERTLGLIANGLADASEAMRGRDLGEIVSDLQNVARRNPLLFLGGAAMIGFAAARFGKATAAAAMEPAYDNAGPG